MSSKKGFTLIELMVVVSIISLLASIILASIDSARQKAQVAGGKEFESTLYDTAGDQISGMWNFNEGQGSQANDSSGNGNTGTLQGPIAWSSDTPYNTGYSLLFGGTTNPSTYVKVSDAPSLNFGTSTDFTLAAWVNGSADATGFSNLPFIIDKRNTFGGVIAGYTLYLTAAGLPDLRVADGTNVIDVKPATGSYSTGQWHYYAVAVSRNLQTATFYVDGVSLGSQSTAPLGNVNTVNNISIGSKGGGGDTLDGEIDNPRIYGKTLTAFEIHNLYAEDLSSHLLTYNSK